MRIRALSLHRPWGEFVIAGLKTIETRRWKHLPVCLVGNRLAIHSGQVYYPRLWRDEIGASIEPWRYAALAPDLRRCASRSAVQTGIIGHVRVHKIRWLVGDEDDCRAALCDTAGRVGLYLHDPVRLPEPIICPGNRGFWWVDIPD